jgi:hypothetical protein
MRRGACISAYLRNDVLFRRRTAHVKVLLLIQAPSRHLGTRVSAIMLSKALSLRADESDIPPD